MKKIISLTIPHFAVVSVHAQRSDAELSRDSVLDWRYLVNRRTLEICRATKAGRLASIHPSIHP